MNKKAVIEMIQKHLEEELVEENSGEENSELKRALLMYRFLPVREFTTEDVIAPGCLTELQLGSRKAWYLLVPQHGGLVTQFEGNPVQVITPQSPMGEAILGKRCGDEITVKTSSGERHYQVLQIL
jgi:hypothetical protein